MDMFSGVPSRGIVHVGGVCGRELAFDDPVFDRVDYGHDVGYVDADYCHDADYVGADYGLDGDGARFHRY
jgi:hypothetical protein